MNHVELPRGRWRRRRERQQTPPRVATRGDTTVDTTDSGAATTAGQSNPTIPCSGSFRATARAAAIASLESPANACGDLVSCPESHACAEAVETLATFYSNCNIAHADEDAAFQALEDADSPCMAHAGEHEEHDEEHADEHDDHADHDGPPIPARPIPILAPPPPAASQPPSVSWVSKGSRSRVLSIRCVCVDEKPAVSTLNKNSAPGRSLGNHNEPCTSTQRVATNGQRTEGLREWWRCWR